MNARTGQEVEVWEHAKHVMENPELFGLHPSAVADMGAAQYAQDADLRRQLLIDVMKRGWIRVRSHKGRHVFETANINDNVLYTILEFAQAHNMWDNERVMVNDVTKPEGHGTTSLTVGQLQKQFGIGEQLSRVRNDEHSIITVWTNIEDAKSERDAKIEEVLAAVIDDLSLMAGPEHVPWSLREEKDNLDQLKLVARVENWNMLTESPLEPRPLLGAKTSLERLRKIAEGAAKMIERRLTRIVPSLVASGDIEVACKTVSRL